MGQYYEIVNLTKKVVIDPYMLNAGKKLGEIAQLGSKVSNIFLNLLQKDWSGDEVYVIGDYAQLNDSDEDQVWQAAYKKVLDAGYNSDSEGFVFKSFTGSLKELSKKPPFMRYIYNTARLEYIDLLKCPGKEMITCQYVLNPLMLLLAMGNGQGGGDYFGDYMELVGLWTNTSNAIRCMNEKPSDDLEELDVRFIYSQDKEDALCQKEIKWEQLFDISGVEIEKVSDKATSMPLGRVIELLKIERECVQRNEIGCDRDCAKCDLVQETQDLLEAYDKAVGILEKVKDFMGMI